MKKVKAKIVKIEEEPDSNGNVLLKITLESDSKNYEFAARAEDYANEQKRKSLNKMFIKTIKMRQIEDTKTVEEKAKRGMDIKALEQTEIVEEQYD